MQTRWGEKTGMDSASRIFSKRHRSNGRCPVRLLLAKPLGALRATSLAANLLSP